MFIEKIRFQNFKSIYEPFEIDFRSVQGMWKINGKVGAGKTTIGEGILFGLFGTVNNKNNGDLISWGRKHGLIELWCTSKGHALYIKRELNAYGQSPIYVEVDGEPLIFTDKRNAQSQLENEYYDISRNTVELTCIITFNNVKALTSLNAKDTRNFLDSSLGLELLNVYAENCKNMQGEVLREMNEVFTQIDRCESQINKIKDLTQQMISESSKEDLQSSIKTLQEQIKILDADMVTTRNKYRADNDSAVRSISSVETRGKILSKEIAFIEKGICPTCGAKIDNSGLDAKKSEIEKLRTEHQSLNTLKRTLDTTYRDYSNEYKAKTARIREEIAQIQKDLAVLSEREKYADMSENEISTIRTKIASLHKKTSNLQMHENEWGTIYNIITTTVRTKIIESFIHSLNKNLGVYASILHLPYSVNFDNDFKCNLTLSSSGQTVPISSLSAGQTKIVDMITILGVLGTITRHSGINIIFLDELFSNLHAELRIALCSLINKTRKEDSTIFVISHYDIDMSIFSGSIDVEINPIQQEYHSNITINQYKQ